MTKISVIIVNFNGGDYPAKALRSLAAQSFRDFEVLFVDNASSDGSADALSSEGLPSFELIRLEENTGFAAANNLAARRAGGEWLALLNPDAVAAPDWLEKLMDASARHPRIVHFASAQYDMHAPDRLDGAGDNYLVFGVPWRGGFGRPADELPQEGFCFSPCGAGAFYRRDVFVQLDGFDERFFCYCEDVDLGYRMQRMGHDCVFLPDAVIHHAGGALSGKVSGFAAYHGARNRLWTYLKNTPRLTLLVTLPAHVVLTAMILAKRLPAGGAGDMARGVVDALKGAPQIMRSDDWAPPPRKLKRLELARRMAWSPLRMLGRRTHVRTSRRPEG